MWKVGAVIVLKDLLQCLISYCFLNFVQVCVLVCHCLNLCMLDVGIEKIFGPFFVTIKGKKAKLLWLVQQSNVVFYHSINAYVTHFN